MWRGMERREERWCTREKRRIGCASVCERNGKREREREKDIKEAREENGDRAGREG